MSHTNNNGFMVHIVRVSRKFWRYMKDSNQLLGTRTELRLLYKDSFQPTLKNEMEKMVLFGEVMWYFRSKKMKVIEWRPANDRENIVYQKGKTVAVDQSYVLKRERKQTQESRKENLGAFAELKKKLVEQR